MWRIKKNGSSIWTFMKQSKMKAEARIIALIKFNLEECASSLLEVYANITSSVCNCTSNSLCVPIVWYFNLKNEQKMITLLSAAAFNSLFCSVLSRAQHNNVSMQSIQIHFWDIIVSFFVRCLLPFVCSLWSNFFFNCGFVRFLCVQTICSNGFPQIAIIFWFSFPQIKKKK